MRSGSTRREFLGAVASVTAAGAVSGRAAGQSNSSPGEEWPEFGFDAANTGHSPDGTGPATNVGGLWTARTGRVTVQPAVTDGVVYLAGQDGRVHAFDTSGNQLPNWPVGIGAPSGSAPAVADGTLYVGDDDGVLHALDTDTGDETWRFGTGGRIETPPTVVGETVYVSSAGGGVYAIGTEQEGETVTERWSFDTGDDRAISSGPAVASVDTGEGTEQLVVFGTDSTASQNAAVFARSATSGDERWSQEVRGPVTSTPTIADGSVFVGTGVDGDPRRGRLYNIDAASGNPRGEPFDTRGRVVASPAVADGTVYVGSRNGLLYAVDATTGAQEWRFRTGPRPIASSPAVVDDTVYVTSRSGVVYGLTTDGDELWSFETDGSQFASPAVAGGVVYLPVVTSTEGARLYALGEGGGIPSGTEFGTDSGEDPGSAFASTGPESDYAFLVVPAAFAGFLTLVAGVGYAVVRSGVTERFTVDEAPVEKLYEDEEEIPGEADRDQSEIWELVVGDVIKRADEADKTATQNVIVSKHVDADTLDSPVVAYEIESARDEPARVTISEPVADAGLSEADQPLNEGWTVGDTEAVFETTVGPGETVRTMIGRPDAPAADELLEALDVRIDPVDD